jgi:hypothetical protein
VFHPDQHSDGIGTGRMAGLSAAPFINVLLALGLKSKTDDWGLPNPRATALFSYYVIWVSHKPYYKKTSFRETLVSNGRRIEEITRALAIRATPTGTGRSNLGEASPENSYAMN